ncbi:DNA transposase THAP9 [Labeo rohita]|uniref:DNA transposase THAP9 n=1 Tax=Labeo rohita TaxID=84645 RepID=A0ABQ8LJL9_LABRO|nr:DNA transposase THAP9 [Labeo rohita]
MAQSSCRCYCSVPCCSNNKHKFPYLSFHDFPVDAEIRACWVRAIKRDEGPSFKILCGSTYVWSQHFTPEDISTSASGRTRIKKGATPSRFPWNDWGKGRASQARQPVYQRARKHFRAAVLDESQEMPVGDFTEEALPVGGVAKDHDYAYHPSPGKLDAATRRIQELELQVLSLEREIQQLTVKQQQPLIFKFCVTDEDFRYYTRFSSKEVFTVFWESVYPSASRLLYWSKAQRTAQETPSPQRKLPLIDELFMFLCRVAAGLLEKTLSSIFEVSLSTVSRIILTWTSYLYQVLGSLPLWMTREQVQATMPDKFKLYCPQVRAIIDCTEIRCETASSLLLQSETFSNYKNHTTFKGLIGIAPCGVITFVSKLYTGSISDIEITRQSQILQLLQPEDGVMADKGFQIEKMLSQVGATLIIPPLKTSNQLSTEDTQKTQAIARLRILVERVIRRVKEYHIWDGLVPLSMAGSVNQLWAICCVLSNYQGPLDIKGDKPV